MLQGGMAGIGIIAVLRFVSGAAASNTAPTALAYLSQHALQCPNLHASLVPASMAAGACAAAGCFEVHPPCKCEATGSCRQVPVCQATGSRP